MCTAHLCGSLYFRNVSIWQFGIINSSILDVRRPKVLVWLNSSLAARSSKSSVGRKERCFIQKCIPSIWGEGELMFGEWLGRFCSAITISKGQRENNFQLIIKEEVWFFVIIPLQAYPLTSDCLFNTVLPA